MSRRGRTLAFAALAVLCAGGSAALASRYRADVAEDYGALAPVVVVTRALTAGEPLRAETLRRALRVRTIPRSFVPADALGDPAEALGARALAEVPPGSFLLASHLQAGPAEPAMGPGRRPIEVRVAGAPTGAGTGEVDVVAAEEAGIGGRGRVRVLARSVPLLGLRGRGGSSGTGRVAVLGLRRREALRVIEAENFARQLRLIPR